MTHGLCVFYIKLGKELIDNMLTGEMILDKIVDEYTLINSEFMNKIIEFQKSIYEYYKKYHEENIYKHPIKYLKYLKIKFYLYKHNYTKYIDIYLNHNPGWYTSEVIPEDKVHTKVEIITSTGKHIHGKMSGYGYIDLKQGNSCTFGWQVWVRRWRFLPGQLNTNIEETERETND